MFCIFLFLVFFLLAIFFILYQVFIKACFFFLHLPVWSLHLGLFFCCNHNILVHGSLSRGANGPRVCADRTSDHRASHHGRQRPAKPDVTAWRESENGWTPNCDWPQPPKLTEVSLITGYTVQRWFTATLTKNVTTGMTRHDRRGQKRCDEVMWKDKPRPLVSFMSFMLSLSSILLYCCLLPVQKIGWLAG